MSLASAVRAGVTGWDAGAWANIWPELKTASARTTAPHEKSLADWLVIATPPQSPALSARLAPSGVG